MKEIHVNAYTKSDGTHVKEHYRTLDSDDYTITPQGQRQNFNSIPMLTGGISMDVDAEDILQGGVSAGGIDWGNIGSAIGQAVLKAADAAIKAAPIALQMYQAVKSSNDSAIQYLKPQFDNSIKSLEETQKVMKQNLENNLNKLTSAKNQEEYANLYKSFTNENETYKKTSDSITRIKHAASNNDYETVVNELDNYKNLQKNVISDSFINNQVDFSKMQASKNTQQYKPNLSGMNYAPMPSPYMNPGNESYAFKGSYLLRPINNYLNKSNPDARLLMDMGLEISKYLSKSSNEYMVIPKICNQAINNHLKLRIGDLEIPEDWQGFVFESNSSISRNLSNSKQLQQQLKKANKNGSFVSDKISIELNQDKNLHYSIGHGTILNPQITADGYFEGIMYDKYDYEFILRAIKNIDWTLLINNIAYLLQQIQLIKNYFILVPIKFKW